MSRHDLALAGWVAVGGALGSIGRFLVGVALPRTGFPVATLLVNVVGSFSIGLVLRWAAQPAASAELRLFLATGLCGGFTTLSALSAETVTMLQEGAHGRALAYVALTVALSLGATFLGLAAGRAAVSG